MFNKFVKEIDILTERRTAMGIDEFLIDRAEKKGRNERDVSFTKSLLTGTDFSTAKIAELVGVKEDFVIKIKKELASNS